MSGVTSACTSAPRSAKFLASATVSAAGIDVVAGAVQQKHRGGGRSRERGRERGRPPENGDVRQQNRSQMADIARVDVVHERLRWFGEPGAEDSGPLELRG